MASSQEFSVGQQIAAIDLGSNSFHMIIGRVIEGEIRILGKLAEKVQLAAALDERHYLSSAVQEKALACLERFAQRLVGIPRGRLRVVGTNALRAAKNARAFMDKAEKLLDCSIEIIGGREEARLIYLGVAHTLADDQGRRLVIDIGGGSTELIIGERFESQILESLHMGCVNYMQKFFPKGKIDPKRFHKAVLAARREILSVEANYKKMSWDHVVGASGTIGAVAHILQQNGWAKQGINAEGLAQLVKIILQNKNAAELKINGLKEDRKLIFPSGVAILTALFQQLGIQHLYYSEGALREGVLYDLLGRQQHEDVRDRTMQALVKRYQVDVEQAGRVSQVALMLFDQIKQAWKINASEFRDVLARAAYLHELGLAVSHTAFHKHGAYLIRYADLPGFSRQEQQAIAALVRCHRRKLDLQVFKELPENWYRPALLLTFILRWAVLLRHPRIDIALPDIVIKAEGKEIFLIISAVWLAAHPLTEANFEQEKNYLAMIGIVLSIIFF